MITVSWYFTSLNFTIGQPFFFLFKSIKNRQAKIFKFPLNKTD